MKKVLAIFDGKHFSTGSIDFVRTLNDQEPVLLTGIFLPSVDYSDVMMFYLGGLAGPLYVPFMEEDPQLIEANIARFKAACAQHGIEHRVHQSPGNNIISEIQKETRYADLLVLSSELFYSNLGSYTQEEYLKDAMHRSECPIVVVPEQYEFPKSIVIAFDGSESSVYAIKQFAYVLPEMRDVKVLVVYASSDEEDQFPDLPYLEELAARHFTNLTFFKLDTNPTKYFNTWVANAGAPLLVTGSYGRNAFSELFRKNFVSETIMDHKIPVFIAHK